MNKRIRLTENLKKPGLGYLPEEWQEIELKRVIKDIKNGFASGKRDKEGIVQVRMNNVTTDGRLKFDSFIKVPIPENINELLLKENDFLFNNTNSIDLVGKSAVVKKVEFPCTFSNHFTLMRFTDEIMPEWVLFHTLTLWKKGFFKSIAIRHVGQAAIQAKYLLNMKIPLPPFKEQKKIAEVLLTVDQAIEKVEEAIEKTQRLKKGLMQELLTKGIGHKEFKEAEIGRIPKEWEIKNFEDISVDFISGGTPSTVNKKYWNGDIAWMTSAHISGREIINGQRYITKEGLKNSATNIVPKDNLLVATRVGIGKAAINRIDVAISQDLTGIIIDKEQAITDFVYWLLINNENKLKSLGQGSTIKGILRENLGKIKVPLPPIPKQQKIAEILGAVDKRLELLKNRKESLEKIKRGLMEDLLTGRKRVKLET